MHALERVVVLLHKSAITARTVFGGSGWNDDQVETAASGCPAERTSAPRPRRPQCTAQFLAKHITLLGYALNLGCHLRHHIRLCANSFRKEGHHVGE